MSSKIRQLRRKLPCAETHSVECLHQGPGGVGMARPSAPVNVLASGQRFAHVPPVWTRARLLSQIFIHSTFKLCASLAQCAAACPCPWPLSLGARFAFFILWLAKSEQFKLMLSLASSCGGYLGYILGHVLIISKKKQIFHKPLSILDSSRSTYMYTGLGKNNKSPVRFFLTESYNFVEMVPHLDGPSAVQLFSCIYLFPCLYFLPGILPVSQASGQHPDSGGKTWLGSSAMISMSFQEYSERRSIEKKNSLFVSKTKLKVNYTGLQFLSRKSESRKLYKYLWL